MANPSEDIFIGRQPILDHKQELFAYELLFRSGTQNAASVQDDLAATINVIGNAFSEFGLTQALGPYKGFINCDAALLLSDLPELLPAEKIVLEVLETVEVTPEIVARCAELKQKGFTLAIDDFIDDVTRWDPLLDLVDIVKVDLSLLDKNALAVITKALKQRPLKLLAEKVDNLEQYEYCRELGYELFQGYYFAKPTIISGRKLGQSQLALLKLMSLILSDAETTALETELKHQPGLAMNLLKLTNSVATGIRMKTTSLRHAITVLGRRQLQRWLQLVLYTAQSNRKIPDPLMHLAATRGRFIELLAARLRPGNRDFEDHAFITGIMSLMPTLMSASMEDILQGLQLDALVTEALLERKGDLGNLLNLAEALETAAGADCQTLCELVRMSPDDVNACLSEAMAWASNIGQEND